VKKAWELFDLLKKAQPIQSSPINDKSTMETIKNPVK